MEWLKNVRKSSISKKPFRRIYKGEVPYLRDSDADIQRSLLRASVSVSGRVARKSMRSPSGWDEAEESKPKSVRRQSIAPNLLPAEITSDLLPEKFNNNVVLTARYTMWNFVPKNLFEQFRRVVNFYFLVIAFIQTVVDSPVHPVTAVSPLAFVILVTAIKQGYEDWLRHKSDDQVNNRPVKVIRDGELQGIKAKDVQVGDIVKLESDEQVPTDILLLGTNDEFLRCQINTANLDGETNLKLRYCPSGIPHFTTVEDFDHLHLIVECEHPCEDLYDFNGSLLIPTTKLTLMHQNVSATSSAQIHPDTNHDGKSPGKGRHTNAHEQHFPDLSGGVVRQGMTDFLSIPLSMENMVLRGTRLKNTDYIYGIVVYTGKDTRLAKNSEKSEAKFSTVERAVNYYLIFFVALLLFFVTFCSIAHYTIDFYPGSGSDGPWYLKNHLKVKTSHKIRKAFTTITSFTVLFNYIIPISLYVTVEMQKFLGSKFFVWDNDMVDDEGREPLCNTSDLNEELGQIEYLFSDKTGTLTQNLMQFCHCSIGSDRFEYKHDHKLYRIAPHAHGGTLVDIFKSNDLLHFFKTLALCHSVQVVPKRRQSFDADVTFVQQIKPGKTDNFLQSNTRRQSLITPDPSAEIHKFHHHEATGEMEFQASSPDEKALLESCERLNIIYRGEKEDVMTLDVAGTLEQYKRLMHLEFDADRKCMSVIVENNKGEIWLFTKGAESSIIPKCDSGPCQVTLKHVMDYARMGLRTLAVAERKLTTKEYETFSSEMRAARRQLKNRQEKVREVYSSIESHMTLIGATGVEDQLQDHVPETLQAFAAAGIRVWMLTGDKLETGVNVAVACGLITTTTKQHVVSKMTTRYDVENRLMQLKDKMDPVNSCFVIDGDSLNVSFKYCPDLLKTVSMAASRVVCCRMAPLQKAQVVQMVKNSPGNPTCCAIGDGANDCAMILAAHIGIGILGKEGRQAARCADFALAKFGHIRKAVLVHGHWYYVRLANLANYFFYKNVVFVLPQFFFSFHSNFSTQALFSGLFLMNFNIFFSACPIFFYGLTEQPYSAEMLLKEPHLYRKNKKNALMTIRKFLPWLISSFWHGAVCYYLPYFAWDNFHDIDDVMIYGTVVFTGVVICTNNKIAVEAKFISWWYVGSQVCSYAAYFVFTATYFEADLFFANPGDFRGVYFYMMRSICFWLLMVLVAVIGILPDIIYVAVQHSWEDLMHRFQGLGKVWPTTTATSDTNNT